RRPAAALARGARRRPRLGGRRADPASPRDGRGGGMSVAGRVEGRPVRVGDRRSDVAIAGLAFAAFVGVWQLVVLVGGLPAFILPGPLAVAGRFVRAWTDGTIWPHFVTTVSEVVLGFAAGSTLGIIVGYGLARSRALARIASPYLVAAQAVPI